MALLLEERLAHLILDISSRHFCNLTFFMPPSDDVSGGPYAIAPVACIKGRISSTIILIFLPSLLLYC